MTMRAAAGALAALLLLGACAARRETVRVGDRELPARLLYATDFRTLDDWTSESSCPPSVAGGELVWPCGGADGIGTIWNNRRFEGPLLVTYTVTSMGGMHNINFIAYADHPQGVLETSRSRTGAYPEYHAFPNYILTFLTNGEARWRVRFRKDPGFALLSEAFADMDTTSGVPHRVAYLFDGAGRIALYADGRLVHSAVDSARPYRAGHLGLRTWRTSLRYRDFRVYQLRCEAGTPACMPPAPAAGAGR
jgi:hypothetical protein